MKKLIIQRNLDVSDYSFIVYIKREVCRLILSSLDNNKLKPFEKYINQDTNVHVYARQVITSACSNMRIFTQSTFYQIKIDTNVKIFNKNLWDLCELLNSGNAELNPYPIFDSVFDIVSNNIGQYYAEWRNM